MIKGNTINVCDGYCEILLSNRDITAMIDVDDLEKAKQYTWYLGHNGYVQTFVKRKVIRLHQLVLGIKKGYVIDHISRDKLDNHKSNLRHATVSQNGMNSKLRSDNTSDYKGVIWEKRRKKWQASICLNSKYIFLGYFIDLSDAISARVLAESKYFREFANC